MTGCRHNQGLLQTARQQKTGEGRGLLQALGLTVGMVPACTVESLDPETCSLWSVRVDRNVGRGVGNRGPQPREKGRI